jgi:hypothetical protein
LNINLTIDNERLEYKISLVWGMIQLGGQRVNEGDEGEAIWLIDFVYLYEIEQRNMFN